MSTLVRSLVPVDSYFSLQSKLKCKVSQIPVIYYIIKTVMDIIIGILGDPKHIRRNYLSYSYDRNLGPIFIEGVPVEGGDLTGIEVTFFKTLPSAEVSTFGSESYLLLIEIPVTIDELRGLQIALTDLGMNISAIHNHWIGDNPKLYYVHAQLIASAQTCANVVHGLLRRI